MCCTFVIAISSNNISTYTMKKEPYEYGLDLDVQLAANDISESENEALFYIRGHNDTYKATIAGDKVDLTNLIISFMEDDADFSDIIVAAAKSYEKLRNIEMGELN